MSKQLQNMQKTSSSRNLALQSTLTAARSPDYKRKDVEDKEAMHQKSKRMRDASKAITKEPNEPPWLQSKTCHALSVERSVEIAATDEDLHDQGEESPVVGGKRATPRRRKKSISKTFVAVGGSTPVSQRYFDETASEEGSGGKMRSSRASSTATDI